MPVSRPPQLVAKGEPSGSMLRTVVAIDPDTHAKIAAIAKRERTSFAEQVRILIEAGLAAGAAI